MFLARLDLKMMTEWSKGRFIGAKGTRRVSQRQAQWPAKIARIAVHLPYAQNPSDATMDVALVRRVGPCRYLVAESRNPAPSTASRVLRLTVEVAAQGVCRRVEEGARTVPRQGLWLAFTTLATRVWIGGGVGDEDLSWGRKVAWVRAQVVLQEKRGVVS